MSAALTARDSLGTWLEHPVGGPLIRGHLARAGVDEKVLAPAKPFSLASAASMSGGRVTPEMVAGLVEEANRGRP